MDILRFFFFLTKVCVIYGATAATLQQGRKNIIDSLKKYPSIIYCECSYMIKSNSSLFKWMSLSFLLLAMDYIPNCYILSRCPHYFFKFFFIFCPFKINIFFFPIELSLHKLLISHLYLSSELFAPTFTRYLFYVNYSFVYNPPVPIQAP